MQHPGKLGGGIEHIGIVSAAEIVDPAGQLHGGNELCSDLPDIAHAPVVVLGKPQRFAFLGGVQQVQRQVAPDGQLSAREIVHPGRPQQNGAGARGLHPGLGFQLVSAVDVRGGEGQCFGQGAFGLHTCIHLIGAEGQQLRPRLGCALCHPFRQQDIRPVGFLRVSRTKSRVGEGGGVDDDVRVLPVDEAAHRAFLRSGRKALRKRTEGKPPPPLVGDAGPDKTARPRKQHFFHLSAPKTVPAQRPPRSTGRKRGRAPRPAMPRPCRLPARRHPQEGPGWR